MKRMQMKIQSAQGVMLEFDSAAGKDTVGVRKTIGGTHGYLPDQADMLAACVVWGPSVKPGTDLGKISMLEIAPTIAELLHVKLPTADGQPLKKVLGTSQAD